MLLNVTSVLNATSVSWFHGTQSEAIHYLHVPDEKIQSEREREGERERKNAKLKRKSLFDAGPSVSGN